MQSCSLFENEILEPQRRIVGQNPSLQPSKAVTSQPTSKAHHKCIVADGTRTPPLARGDVIPQGLIVLCRQRPVTALSGPSRRYWKAGSAFGWLDLASGSSCISCFSPRAPFNTQTSGRIQKVDPPEGSIIYTTEVLEPRIGGSTCWILPGVWATGLGLRSPFVSKSESQSREVEALVWWGGLRLCWLLRNFSR